MSHKTIYKGLSYACLRPGVWAFLDHRNGDIFADSDYAIPSCNFPGRNQILHQIDRFAARGGFELDPEFVNLKRGPDDIGAHIVFEAAKRAVFEPRQMELYSILEGGRLHVFKSGYQPNGADRLVGLEVHEHELSCAWIRVVGTDDYLCLRFSSDFNLCMEDALIDSILESQPRSRNEPDSVVKKQHDHTLLLGDHLFKTNLIKFDDLPQKVQELFEADNAPTPTL